MEIAIPPGIQRFSRHRTRLVEACRVASADEDVVGMTIGGSFAEGQPDEYSDLDLRVVVEDAAFDRKLAEARSLAEAAGPLVAAFTGEHVGEPRLLICLYEDLVHVDYLTVGISALAEQNAGRSALVLWEREGRISRILPGPTADDELAVRLRWYEDRMWTWTWYIHSKILRGEVFEAIDGLTYVRGVVLFRLLAETEGVAHAGARRVEALMGDRRDRFDRTATNPDPAALLDALRATVGLYVELGDPLLSRHRIANADRARATVLRALEQGMGWRPPRT
jgi:hypothetical protein